MKILKNKWFYISAVIILVLILVLSARNKEEEYSYVTVERSNVVQEVSVTGKVKPVQSVSLAFERAGKVTSVLADVGDSVVAGQTLVRLNTTTDVLALRQAEASLEADRAVLSELQSGTRLEDVAILESKLAASRASLNQERQSFVDTLEEAYTVADNVVRNYGDQFFSNPRTASVQLSIPVSDNQLKIDMVALRFQVEVMLTQWNSELVPLPFSDNLFVVAETARERLSLVKGLLDKIAIVVNALSPTQNLSETTITTYRSSVSTARSALTSIISTLSSGADAFSTASSNLDLAQKNLDLALAGTVPEKVVAQEARVLSGEANVASLGHAISLATLRSPISGIVTMQDAKVGEVVAASKHITSIISEEKLEVEAFVPEVDIGFMAVGNIAQVNFDAFPETIFEGTVIYIDPAETVLDGVPTYKIKLSLPTDDMRIRSGMTTNLDVIVAERNEVLSIPYRALSGLGSERTVLLRMSDGSITETSIVTGIRGTSGEIEIISGVSEGSTIAIPKRN